MSQLNGEVGIDNLGIDIEMQDSRDGSNMEQKTNNKNLNSDYYIPLDETDSSKLLKIDFVIRYAKERDVDLIRKKLFNDLEKDDFVLAHASSNDKEYEFILLHAKFDLLMRCAEDVRLEMPLKDQEIDTDTNDTDIDSSCSCFDSLACLKKNESQIKEKRELDLFTAPFQKHCLDVFKNHHDQNNFFTSAQRSMLVYNDLKKRYFYSAVKYGPLTGYDLYPLHDGPFKLNPDINVDIHGYDNDRQELHNTWASFSNCLKAQPTSLIRHYFGEKIGMYFAWLGYYNMWLIPVAVLGILAFIYGLVTLGSNIPGNEICDVNGNISKTIMCPLCDKLCDYWTLEKSCLYSKFVYVFDNEATIFFAIVLSLWATSFLEFWTRKQHLLQYEWDVQNFEENEVYRVEYIEALESTTDYKADDSKSNNKLPARFLYPRYIISCATMLFMICLVIALLIGVIVYRITMILVFSRLMLKDKAKSSNVRLVTTITAAIINIICIVILGLIYKKLAYWLTRLENPKTETIFEDSYTTKVYCFNFVNYYSSLFYIAFFKGYFNGRPGKFNRSFGGRNEECDPAGCLVELVIQMLVVFVFKQILNNILEFKDIVINFLRVKIKGKEASKKAKLEAAEMNKMLKPWEIDGNLAPTDELQLFEEYLELIIQFGFVTLFVAAMPLAPAFALLNNIFEVRLDATKMVKLHRRALAKRASDIGVWMYILSCISLLSVISNAFIIGFTSEQIPRMVYKYTEGDYSLHGYMKWRLSMFETKDFEIESVPLDTFNTTYCFYRDFRYPPGHPKEYKYTEAYWNVLAGRFAFVLLFEHVVLILKGIINVLVPDVPEKIKEEIKKEKELLRVALLRQNNLEKANKSTENDNEKPVAEGATKF